MLLGGYYPLFLQEITHPKALCDCDIVKQLMRLIEKSLVLLLEFDFGQTFVYFRFGLGIP